MLDDTVCIVCGGGRGLGEATAKMMAEHGAIVVVNDLGVDLGGGGADEQPVRTTVDAIRDAGGEAVAHFGDVTDIEYTERLLRDTVEEYGAVHNITNFAGVLRDSMIFNMTEEDFDAVINAHLKGHFSLLRNASRNWRQRYKDDDLDRQRSFTCVSSVATAGNPGQTNYSAAKAGVLGMMRTAARELHRYDVRVNALWPAALTRMTESVPDAALAELDEETFGPQLVAPGPVFLASERAAGITGCTVGLAGGDLSFVSDPAQERTLSKDLETEGGWTAAEIADRWAELSDSFDTHKTDATTGR